MSKHTPMWVLHSLLIKHHVILPPLWEVGHAIAGECCYCRNKLKCLIFLRKYITHGQYFLLVYTLCPLMLSHVSHGWNLGNCISHTPVNRASITLHQREATAWYLDTEREEQAVHSHLAVPDHPSWWDENAEGPRSTVHCLSPQITISAHGPLSSSSRLWLCPVRKWPGNRSENMS